MSFQLFLDSKTLIRVSLFRMHYSIVGNLKGISLNLVLMPASKKKIIQDYTYNNNNIPIHMSNLAEIVKDFTKFTMKMKELQKWNNRKHKIDISS